MSEPLLLPWQKLKLLLEKSSGDTDHAPLAEEDVSFLAVVAYEVTTGALLPQKYPQLYTKLLNNREWRTAFVGLLYVNQPTATSAKPTPLPLQWEKIQQKANMQPVLLRPSWETWEATWQRSIDHLSTLFFPSSTAVLRSLPQITEQFTLLNTEFITGNERYDVLLTAYWPKEEAEQLYVTVAVHYHQGLSPDTPLTATLVWGDYHDTVTVTHQQPQKFTPVPVSLFLHTETDTDEDEIIAPLTFRLSLMDVI